MIKNNTNFKVYRRTERNPTKYKHLVLFLLSIAAFLSTSYLSPIHANNFVSCKISVIGEGEVNVTSSNTTFQVNKENPLFLNLEKGNELIFDMNDTTDLNNVSINGIKSDILQSLKINHSFTYVISNECDIVFDYNQPNLENPDVFSSLDSQSNIQQPFASGPIVTHKTIMNLTSVDLDGGWRVQMNPAYWKIDGNIAFCGHANFAAPDINFVYEPANEMTKSNVRKILYYGYLGPKDQLTSKYGAEKACLITGELVSYYNGNGSILTDELAGDINQYINKYATFMKDSALTVPTSFKTYVCSTNIEGINWKGEKTKYQPMIFWKIVENGTLQIKKESANPEITDNNNYYFIDNAEYTVYKTRNNDTLSNRVGTLKITSTGWSNVLSLEVGTYFIQETKAPTNYILDNTIHTVTIQSNIKTTATYQDEPLSASLSLLVQKINGDNNLFMNQRLENAQFKFKFFKGQYEDGINPADKGILPDRTWIFKTDGKGQILYEDVYKVSGDSLYKTNSNVATLPLGTLTIQEFTPPFGYKINDEIYIQNIKLNANNTIETYNVPIIPNSPIYLKIIKKQDKINIPIAYVSFLHTKPNKTSETLMTNQEGFIQISKMEKGMHKIKEIYTITGLRVNPNEFEFEVLSDGSIQPRTNYLSDLGMEFYTEDENSFLTVYNSPNDFSLIIHKVNQNNQSLDGAEFTLYEDANCKYKIDTVITKNGIVTFKDLNDRTYYYLKETKAPIGYQINNEGHLYKLYTESTPSQNTFNFYVDDIQYNSAVPSDIVSFEGDFSNKIVTFKIENTATMKLPETGSRMNMVLFCSGISFMVLALNKRFITKQKEKKI